MAIRRTYSLDNLRHEQTEKIQMDMSGDGPFAGCVGFDPEHAAGVLFGHLKD